MLRAFPNYKHSLYNINKGGKRFRILMGGFVNIGKDIEKDDIIFGMKLPEGSSIIEGVKIKTSDNNFKVSSTFNNNLQFKIESSFLKRDFLSML